MCKFYFWLNCSFRTARKRECQDDFGYSEEGKLCQGGPRTHKYKCTEMRSSNISAVIGLVGLNGFNPTPVCVMASVEPRVWRDFAWTQQPPSDPH